MFQAKRKLLVLLALQLCQASLAAQAAPQNATTNAHIEPLKLSSLSGYTASSKRGSSAQDQAGSATAKSYEPPPEFYRGPGSGSTSDTTAANYVSKLAGSDSQSHLGSVSDKLSEAYNKWRPGVGYNNRDGLQERISVGHHYAGSPLAQNAHGSSSYAYEPQPYDYATRGGSSAHYGSSGTGGGAYYGSSSSETVGVPFDVYGMRPGAGHGHYAGAGGEYSYTSYPVEGHDLATHKGPPELSQKAVLAKSFLIPLASAVVLGIAAALVSNPLLLQLGTVSGVGLGPTVIGKRKRRAVGRPKLQRAFAAYQ